MTAQIFRLPDLGEGLTEAVLIRWLVSVGDSVAVDQPIAEVETAKSVVEVPSPYAGTISALHGEEGQTLEVGAPLIEVEPAGGSGNVLIGYGTSGHGTKGRTRRPARGPVATAAVARVGDPIPVRSPIVRHLAQTSGVDLRAIAPTGTGGVITRGDVLGAAKALASGKAPAHRPATAASEEVAGLTVARRESLSMLRKAVAAKMSRSRAEIPEATVWVDVDATELWAVRTAMAEGGRSPSLTAFLAKYVLLALADYPVLGGRLSDDGTEILEFDGVNLGLAADTPRGVMVPVVRHAERLSIGALDQEVRRLADAARAGTLAPDELSGSTITLNNYGALGVDGSAAIINHPEVAILGVGRMIERPWVVEGAIVPRRIVQLSLVFDHRVCDGGYASGFLRSIVEAIENPYRAYRLL
jgi:2-oxoisovalerate dehydrogenase E2 component (dihydrolipoyl transacylase)